MDDVKSLAVENLQDRICLRPCDADLLGHQRREKPQGATQTVHGYVWVISEWLRRLALGEHFVAIHAVNDVHFVPALG